MLCNCQRLLLKRNPYRLSAVVPEGRKDSGGQVRLCFSINLYYCKNSQLPLYISIVDNVSTISLRAEQIYITTRPPRLSLLPIQRPERRSGGLSRVVHKGRSAQKVLLYIRPRWMPQESVVESRREKRFVKTHKPNGSMFQYCGPYGRHRARCHLLP